MKERPILFSAPMVRALLAGRKGQTRRVAGLEIINADPDRYRYLGVVSGPGEPHYAFHDEQTGAQTLVRCRTSAPGDRLWVRESWAPDPPDVDGWGYAAWAGCREGQIAGVPERFRHPAYCVYAADWLHGSIRWTPSIHMPRWASRITLEITGVRVERLNEISRGDAMAEGCPFPNMAVGDDPRAWFRDLWVEINGAGSWDTNPWVWAIEFRRLP